jgi:PAS domain S-box-containing protein
MGLVSGLALVDVFTGWTLLSLPAVIASLACAAAAVVLGARGVKLLAVCLAVTCLAIHLACSLRIMSEERCWEVLEQEKAAEALAAAVSILDGRFSEVVEFADRVSRRGDLARSLKADSEHEMFSVVGDAAASVGWPEGEYGIILSDLRGEMRAWAGRLPDFTGKTPAEKPDVGMRVSRSTTHYWIEAVRAVGPGEDRLGSITVFRRLDAAYPAILPHAGVRTLSDELTARVGHDVRVQIGEGPDSENPQSDRESASGEIRMPDGSPVGTVVVRGRALDEEAGILRKQGLFVASLAVLALIALGTVVLGRHLVGPRFRKGSAPRIALLLAMIAAARLSLSPLRDLLNLDALEAFTSLHYATQMPTGILRSPADLAITSFFMFLGVSLVIVARAARARSSPSAGSGAGEDGVPLLLLAFVGGLLAFGCVLLADRVLGKVLADSSLVFATLSPFDFSTSHVVMRVGMFILTSVMILLPAALVRLQISMVRQSGVRGRIVGRPILLSGLTLYVLTAVLVAAGAHARVFLLATLVLVCAHLLDRVMVRRLRVGLISVVVGFALAASLLQFPYARADHDYKQREAIRATALGIMARTDAWKASVLEEALAQVTSYEDIGSTILSGTNLDAFALKLWANSILSKASVTSGVHILDRRHNVIGRFSLEDIGDLSELEGVLREARFTDRPFTRVTRGTFGRKDVELYVGVIPYFNGDTYLGCVVISIPYAYGDLESIAGVEPTFFEAVGSGAARHSESDEIHSASLLSGGRIVSTTAKDFEVGKPLGGLHTADGSMPGWVEHRVAGRTHAFYVVPLEDGTTALLLSFRLPSLSEKAVRFMGIVVGNAMLALLIVLIGGVVKGTRYATKRFRGMERRRLRWSFASKLALAFVLIAIVPTLILGATSRGFLKARLREIMESKAGESLSLSELALERLVGGEAIHLARNPILIDELTAEPSILGMLVSHDVSAAVIDSTGRMLATFGKPVLPASVLRSVLNEGRSHIFYSTDDGLVANAAIPVRDVIFPDRIKGCAFVSRMIDDGLARRLSSEIGKDLNFFGGSTVAASSKRELFVSELMAGRISPDAYLECFVSGRELHFTWERVGNIDVVVGYSPLRGDDGSTVGAISVPLVFRKDDVGRRMEWTSAAISYLLVIVICCIFAFGLLLARRISKPIRELIRGTLRIGSGDLAFTIPKSGDDEIGDLVSSFNKMTATLAKSRKTLSERKRYIETIIGNVGAGIISTDWRGRIDTFNSAAERMLGIKGRNARGRDANNLLRKIGAAGLAAVLDEVEGEHSVVRKEAGLARDDAGPVTLRAVATVVTGPRGRQMGKVIVFEDVTELIRSKKLIAWSEMARQVAHEIKNPLTPMKLSAQHLLQSHRDGAGDFDQVLEDSVATIVEQIESLRRIAVEFSQFSRLPQRNLENIDINRVLEESLMQYEQTVGSSIEIQKHLNRSIPRPKADRDELKRVFLNVIENAIQAMPDGGKLEIRSVKGAETSGRARYEFRVSSRSAYQNDLKDYVEVSFADTGAGISPGDAERLFEPNFSTKTQGSGLGLAISKGIIDGYAGEIVIESTPGTGTCVSVRIPLAERQPSHRPRKSTRRMSRRGPQRDSQQRGRRPRRGPRRNRPDH